MGRERAYTAAVWGLWALACLLLGLAASLVGWMTAALLRWPPPLGVAAVWPLVSGLLVAAAAPWVRGRLDDGEPD